MSFAFESSPTMFPNENEWGMHQENGDWVRWPLRLNGPAIAEAVRLYHTATSWTEAELLNCHTSTLLWDPNIYLASHAGAEPTENQYRELSQRMRLRTDREFEKRTPTNTKEEKEYSSAGERLYHFEPVQYRAFNRVIPQVMTYPSTIPAIAAAMGQEPL